MLIAVLVALIILLVVIIVKLGRAYIFKCKECENIRLEINRVDTIEHAKIQKKLETKTWLDHIKNIVPREGLINEPNNKNIG